VEAFSFPFTLVVVAGTSTADPTVEAIVTVYRMQHVVRLELPTAVTVTEEAGALVTLTMRIRMVCTSMIGH